MLRYAAICLIIAVLAFIVGFLGNAIAGGAVVIAKFAFFVFLTLFIILFGIHLLKHYKKK